LDEGLHIASVGKPPEVASPPFKLALNADYMTLYDFK
jgi:hypothetical protein